MNDLLLFLTVLMAGLAILLFIVSCASWYRLRHLRFALTSAAFAVFICKAILLLSTYIVEDEKAILLDSVILILLYFSIAKR